MTTLAAAKPDIAHPRVLVPVESSNVEALGHNTHGLFVRFKGGGIYLYHGVPESVFHAALAAGSVGSFVHERVKGHYRHEKL